MRGRLLLAKWGFVLGTGTVAAQLPPFPQTTPSLPMRSPTTYPATLPGLPAPTYPVPAQPQPQPQPQPPGALPPLRGAYPVQPGAPMLPGTPGALTPGTPGLVGLSVGNGTGTNPIAQPQQVPLPQPENKMPLNARDVNLKRVSGGWQLWAGYKMLRDFGENENAARDTLRVFKDLHPTEWVTIGSQKPIVEYALVDGRPAATAGVAPKDDANGFSNPGQGGSFGGPLATGAGASRIVAIDLKSVRVEAVRGVWCLRDDDNIHFNFGPVRSDAEQALAVIQRYGFNRIGIVGQPIPVMSYFFVGSEQTMPTKADTSPLARVAVQAQIEGLTRVGIPVPGLGYIGEMVQIDSRKLTARKDGNDWVLASGADILGRFGPNEWTARDAARTLSEAHFTEFCKMGSAGITFFLTNGKAPTRVPFSTQGRRFDPAAMKVQQYNGGWAVTDNGRHLFSCANAAEGENLIRVVKHFGFDQLCHVGPNGRVGISFLAKSR